MMETRKPSIGLRSTPLPVDYLKMIGDVFTTHFADSLKALSKVKAKPFFLAKGAVFPEEVYLSVSLQHEGHLAATTVHASSDFDPKASSPTPEDILAACVDTLGDVIQTMFGENVEKQLKAIAAESLADLENVPYEWTSVNSGKHKIFVMVDKSNPVLDEAAEQWLDKNDPRSKEEREQEAREAESMIITGKKHKGEIH